MKTTHSIFVFTALATNAPAAFTTYRVTQSIGSLSAPNPASADNFLYLSFQLTDGTNSGNNNSFVKVSNLGLTGGAFGAPLPDIGNVAVEPSGAFTLRDGPGAGNAVADHTLEFRVTSPMATLTYDFTVETTGIDMPTPDGFNVAFLDYDLSVVRTLGPTGNEMVNFSLTGSPTASPSVYSVDPLYVAGRTVVGDNRFVGLGMPVITPVPEPASMAAVGVGAFGVFCRRRRARRSPLL